MVEVDEGTDADEDFGLTDCPRWLALARLYSDESDDL